MSDELRPRFWENVPLNKMTPQEWEALCDGCGKCCLNKVEMEDTGEVVYTRVSCRLFDGETCRCSNYANRLKFVPECVVLTPALLKNVAFWLPASCAYKRLYQGKSLPEWHPLLTGDPNSTHTSGNSWIGQTISEVLVDEEDWDQHFIEEEL